jgi:putative transposase
MGLAGGGASRKRRREHTVWQRRFWEHLIRDEDDLRRHADYIHYNPVKHGYVSRPDAWPHSTLARFVQRGWYGPDWGSVEPNTAAGCETTGE